MSLCKAPLLRDNLLPYLEGELPIPEAEKMAQHLESCPACAEEARALRESLKLLIPGGCLSHEALLSFVEGGEVGPEEKRHLQRCPECGDAVKSFEVLHAGLPSAKAERVPEWFTQEVRRVFPRRTGLSKSLGWFTFSRPSMAFAAYAVLAFIFASTGIFYNVFSPLSAPRLYVEVTRAPVREYSANKMALPRMKKAAVHSNAVEIQEAAQKPVHEERTGEKIVASSPSNSIRVERKGEQTEAPRPAAERSPAPHSVAISPVKSKPAPSPPPPAAMPPAARYKTSASDQISAPQPPSSAAPAASPQLQSGGAGAPQANSRLSSPRKRAELERTEAGAAKQAAGQVKKSPPLALKKTRASQKLAPAKGGGTPGSVQRVFNGVNEPVPPPSPRPGMSPTAGRKVAAVTRTRKNAPGAQPRKMMIKHPAHPRLSPQSTQAPARAFPIGLILVSLSIPFWALSGVALYRWVGQKRV